MTASEIHEALSKSLGDAIRTDTAGGIIPDGVQYSKSLRDNYLDRAIQYILKEYFKMAQQPGTDDESAIIWGLFPTFTRNNTINIVQFQPNSEYLYPLPGSFVTSDIKSPLTIMDMSFVYIDGSGYITRSQVPVMQPGDYNEHVSRRFAGTHYSDSCATYYGSNSGLRVYISPNENSAVLPDHIECNYLPQPKDMKDHAWDEQVDFEEMYLGTVLSLATMYGINDRGDTNEQIMAQTIIPTITKL